METKTCNTCKIEKPFYEFHKDKSKKDGHSYRCKDCKRLYNKQYQKDNVLQITNQRKQYRADNASQISKQKKRWYVANILQILKQKKQYRKNNAPQILKQQKQYDRSMALFETYFKKLEVFEEVRRSPENSNLLEVKCAYCGKWTKIINAQVRDRILVFNGVRLGEYRFYCSKACKISCPIFNQKRWPKGFKTTTSREVDVWFRQYILETDNWTCQKCFVSKEENPELVLHVHHIHGVAQQPLLQNDIDNAITLCVSCHKEIHETKGCTYFDFRRPKCKSMA